MAVETGSTFRFRDGRGREPLHNHMNSFLVTDDTARWVLQAYSAACDRRWCRDGRMAKIQFFASLGLTASGGNHKMLPVSCRYPGLGMFRRARYTQPADLG
jgi:hypothetical protein